MIVNLQPAFHFFLQFSKPITSAVTSCVSCIIIFLCFGNVSKHDSIELSENSLLCPEILGLTPLYPVALANLP
jgi:hypothetical protein